VGEAEQVEQTVKGEASEFGSIRHTVLACLGARPVAGNVDFSEKSGLTWQVRFVAAERDDVGRAVAFQEPAIQFVYPSVVHKHDVDGGSARLELLSEKPAEASEVGVQAAVLRTVDTGLQCSEAQLVVSR
jgi:hypothetical protein